MGQGNRNRPRNDELGCGGHGGRRAGGGDEPGGRPDHAVRRRVRRVGASGRSDRWRSVRAVTNPENTVFSIKRFMGRKFDEVSEEMKMVPYRVVRASNGDARVQAGDKELSPPEISAMVLQKLKQAAEEYLGQSVAEAVITVPGVLQRRPAPGHQGRRPDRRPRRAAHRQRAHRGPPSPTGSTRRRTRPSPSTTSGAARSTSRSSRSARASSRSSRPTATPTSGATTSTSASSSGSPTSSGRATASTSARTAWPSSA